MMTVKEVSRLTGVSIRALRHYHAIGLLEPAAVTEAGYRLYDDAALQRLQTILLFRELQFPLRQIREILDSPVFDPGEALEQQIRLLELQRDHLNTLIEHARQLWAGGNAMNFKPYDKRKLDQYAEEARARWGNTEAYREFEKKTAGQTEDAQQSDAAGLMAIFTEIGTIRHLSPASAEAQALIGKLQAFITEHYYTCTPQILRGLGQMYIAGGEMTENIDRAGGEGTAAFAQQAIEVYTK